MDSQRTYSPTAHHYFFGAIAAGDEAELERQFFSNLILPNGTFKTTRHGRLHAINDLVLAHLPATRPLTLMDVAASSGVSTVEWSEQLTREGIEHTLVAGDLLVNAWLVSVAPGLRVLVDGAATPLQYEIGGTAYRVDLSRRKRLLRLFALNRLNRVAASLAGRLPPAGASATVDGMEVRGVTLASRRLREHDRVRIIEDDISRPGQHLSAFDAIRAANILNRVYFDAPTLAGMVVNLERRLRLGGVLVVCRTLEDDTTHGSVFRKETTALRELARLGDGSEIADIVTATRVSVSPRD